MVPPLQAPLRRYRLQVAPMEPVSEFGKLRSSKSLRAAVTIVFMAAICISGFSELYIRFHYAAVMPRSPQPGIGRVYPMPAQYGGTIYVNKAELDRRDFVRYDLDPISMVIAILCFSVGAWLGWWPNGRKPFAGGLARK